MRKSSHLMQHRLLSLNKNRLLSKVIAKNDSVHKKKKIRSLLSSSSLFYRYTINYHYYYFFVLELKRLLAWSIWFIIFFHHSKFSHDFSHFFYYLQLFLFGPIFLSIHHLSFCFFLTQMKILNYFCVRLEFFVLVVFQEQEKMNKSFAKKVFSLLNTVIHRSVE